MRRGSLLSQPQSVLQKLASISEGNPLAPRNGRGFLFQTLSPEKNKSNGDAPKKQVSRVLVPEPGRKDARCASPALAEDGKGRNELTGTWGGYFANFRLWCCTTGLDRGPMTTVCPTADLEYVKLIQVTLLCSLRALIMLCP